MAIMTRQRKKMTRRAALAGLGGMALGANVWDASAGQGAAAQVGQPARPHEDAIPISGRAGPGLEPLDAVMRTIIDRHGLPGAALALAREGRLILAKGYGWADLARSEQVQPGTRFGLASLSKPITAVATLKLIEKGKLRLNDSVFDLLSHIKPPQGTRIDNRLRTVTVHQCLNHSGGWDRAIRGDPAMWEPQICRAYGVRPPLTAQQFISFAWTLPLDFPPGSESKYSNVGYIILGEVVATVAKQPYPRFVHDNVLKPMGIPNVEVHRLDGRYLAGEAIRYLPGTLIPLPAMRMPMVDATGGWSGSVVDMVRFLTNLDGSRGEPILAEKTRDLMLAPPTKPLRPRENGTYVGLGWDSVIPEGKARGYYKDGSYEGMRTYMKRLPNGVNWAMLFNASMEFDTTDMRLIARTVQEIRQVIERVGKFPNVDYFKEYP
jgi:N-acyl-D-amino-acid deacylase